MQNKEFDTKDINMAHSQLVDRYESLTELLKQYPNDNKKDTSILEKLVVTDLFVEKDIIALEERADELQKQAKVLFKLSMGIILFTAFIALSNMFHVTDFLIHLLGLNEYSQDFSNSTDSIKLWQHFTIILIKSFTAYGLLILLSVVAWKHSKAKYDQAERLYTKRRQDRQLRLFIHLNEGKIKYKEFLDLLKFGQDKDNAYKNIAADAKAPLGSLASDLLKTQASVIKSLASSKKKNANKTE